MCKRRDEAAKKVEENSQNLKARFYPTEYNRRQPRQIECNVCRFRPLLIDQTDCPQCGVAVH